MADAFDVVVIGAGPAGYVCAIRAAQLGLKTACVESGSYEGGLGGTCLNWGCIPAKALLESGALAQNLKDHGEEMGVRPIEVEYDMGAAVDRSRFISDRLTKGIGFLFKKNGVEHLDGIARIAGPGKVEVKPVEGDPFTVETKNIVIATGAVMKSFPGFEIDGEKVIGSREALALRAPPERMVIVGAGYVGVEFADVFNAFGVDVTLVEALDSVVPLADQEIGKTLARSYKKRGMTIRTGTKVKSVDRESSPMILTVETDKGEEQIETDVVLMAVGRSPVTAGLGLEELGVELNGPWVKINEWCER
jgi:dihydrolipoamide dehydrogenase